MSAIPMPASTVPLEQQPVEFVEEVCGIYFRSVLLERPGIIIPQHVHDHDHATFIGSGRVRVWVDGNWYGDIDAGRAIPIKAGTQHVFQSLAPMTRITCVHDVASAMSLKEKGA